LPCITKSRLFSSPLLLTSCVVWTMCEVQVKDVKLLVLCEVNHYLAFWIRIIFIIFVFGLFLSYVKHRLVTRFHVLFVKLKFHHCLAFLSPNHLHQLCC
jgi:hypothetical protein